MLSYTDLKRIFLENIQNPGSTNTTLINQFKTYLNQRHALIMRELENYTVRTTRSTTTVNGQQYYQLPIDCQSVESVVQSVNSINYTLEPVESDVDWNKINALPSLVSAIPAHYFARAHDLGLWPIPQDAYTLTLTYNIDSRPPMFEDYVTGTVSVTNGDATVTGSGTTWTTAMVGRYLQVTDDGYFYRITEVNSTTSLEIETNYDGLTATGAAYRIADCPLFPAEAHILLAQGAVSDWFAGPRNDRTSATYWNNIFWTGSPNVQPPYPVKTVNGGLIGLKKAYNQRESRKVIRRKHKPLTNADILWATRITS